MHRLNVNDASFIENPVNELNALRRHGEVVPIKLPIIGKVWLTLSHAATAEMLKDNQRFTMRSHQDQRRSTKHGRRSSPGQVAGMQWWMPRSLRLLANNMLTQDEPEHRRLRKLVDSAFARAPIQQMAPMIRETADHLLLAQKGQTEFNLVEAYARQLPLLVICQMLGFDKDQARAFADEAGQLTTVSGMVSFLRAILPIRRMVKLLEREIEIEGQNLAHLSPQDSQDRGLMSQLVQTQIDGDRLSRDELIAMVFLLLVAGHETTTHLIAGAVLALLQNPQPRRELQMQKVDMNMAVEELLRFCSPVQMSKPRFVGWTGEFHGVRLKEGDKIMAGLMAANFDPEHFADPGRLDLTRRPNPHLEFGTGIHFCLGHQLARLELKIALQALFEHHPDFQLGQGGFAWKNRLGMRALSALWVRT